MAIGRIIVAVALLCIGARAQMCNDVAANCAQMAAQCFTPPQSMTVQPQCRQTCNICDCVDNANDCAQLAGSCQDPTFETTLRARCPLTCGFCSGCGFNSGGLVPSVVAEAPSRRITVTYPGNVEASCGNTLTLPQVQQAPTVSWTATAGRMYTLMMVDPDAPSRTNTSLAQFLHWWVINIPGSNVAQGQTLATYVAPTPDAGSGLHRYALVVYEQPQQLNSQRLMGLMVQPSELPGFNTTVFVSNFQLGFSYAGNWFQAQQM